MRWDAFEAACPRIAVVARERFERDEVIILGTIRPDGRPRISPCELDLAADRLLLGMMWRSRKALDLRRDPRLAVHSVPSDRMNQGGDVKLSGTAVEENDPVVREAYRDAIRRRIDWAPEEPAFHVFSFEVEQAAFLRFGDDAVAWVWDEAKGLRELPDPFPPVD
ncbi:MAG: pyridoxamine 5'-phosphate oxidase family protein [Actinomycetota bacterium]